MGKQEDNLANTAFDPNTHKLGQQQEKMDLEAVDPNTESTRDYWPGHRASSSTRHKKKALTQGVHILKDSIHDQLSRKNTRQEIIRSLLIHSEQQLRRSTDGRFSTTYCQTASFSDQQFPHFPPTVKDIERESFLQDQLCWLSLTQDERSQLRIA